MSLLASLNFNVYPKLAHYSELSMLATSYVHTRTPFGMIDLDNFSSGMQGQNNFFS